jgi:hypothetical protein
LPWLLITCTRCKGIPARTRLHRQSCRRRHISKAVPCSGLATALLPVASACGDGRTFPNPGRPAELPPFGSERCTSHCTEARPTARRNKSAVLRSDRRTAPSPGFGRSPVQSGFPWQPPRSPWLTRLRHGCNRSDQYIIPQNAAAPHLMRGARSRQVASCPVGFLETA